MFIPYKVDVPMERIPFVNWLVVAGTTSISVLALTDPSLLVRLILVTPGFRLAGVLPPGIQLGFHPLQLLTYMFVHAGYWHLAGNMLFLFVFGNAVNAKLGHAKFLGFYLVCGVLAGLAGLIVYEGLIAGASGAICAVVGCFLVFYPRNEVSTFTWLGWHRPRLFSASALLFVGVYFVFDLIGAVSGASAVAYVSHIVGYLCGVAIGILLLKFNLVTIYPGEQPITQLRATRSRTWR